ncbi:acetyltransferase GNAT family protein [Asticcacaulis biprosthecium C19]|uniref:Acetyltransferase GNAT family protein n=2 Tax=Asticcacaulis biprosthecium TaxID=76891 RepID=F4QL39_9CAUL|nr:acetyltransferase GNAT family protein [Asticcacaulis biprosthecium C19]
MVLYRAAAASGGLSRKPDEITHAYVAGFLHQAVEAGISLMAVRDGQVLGEIHGWPMPQSQFAHVFGDITIAVRPEAQGQGVGRALFQGLIADITTMLPQIRRIELGCRESNARAIALYESLGFVVEGRLKQRVFDEGGFYEDDLAMALLVR